MPPDLGISVTQNIVSKENSLSKTTETAPINRGGFWSLAGLIWLAVILPVGTIFGWVSYEASQFWAPIVLFPILVGSFFGITAVGLIRSIGLGNRTMIGLGIFLGVLILVGVGHESAFRAACQKTDQDNGLLQKARAQSNNSQFGQMIDRPNNLFDFLQKRAQSGRKIQTVRGVRNLQHFWAWASWALDGLLILVMAALIVGRSTRHPYCPQCKSWYRTTRAGKVDESTGKKLNALLGGEPTDDAGPGRYQISTCRGGCQRARWRFAGENGAGSVETRWLERDQLEAVNRILDETNQSN
jgi:hypothetical protein